MFAHETPVRRLPIRFEGDDQRVILRPFVMSHGRVLTLFERLSLLTEHAVHDLLAEVIAGFEHRHDRLVRTFEEHYRMGAGLAEWNSHWSKSRRHLAGAYLTMEYAIDSAALFNPSIIIHPDQTGLPEGTVRFLMSLRATGEGHVSSIVFRTGTVSADLHITTDPLPHKLSRSRVSPDATYDLPLFIRKLIELSVDRSIISAVAALVSDHFTLRQLYTAVESVRLVQRDATGAAEALNTIIFLAQSNYQIDLEPGASISELVIFPMSADESRGIEDLRMVRFVDDDGSVHHYGTYTAYNGFRTLPMMMCCHDFRRFEIHTLNGAASRDKGMALFPRRVHGKYVMCSRIDGENLFISTSDSIYFWERAERLTAPRLPWELMQIGNCGSPIETPDGWLLLTHGVGPMRTYAIGAMLLDLDNPLKVIAHLPTPLLAPVGDERNGYVPNVVYTCGAMLHGQNLLIPYAQADKSSGLAVVDLASLMSRMS